MLNNINPNQISSDSRQKDMINLKQIFEILNRRRNILFLSLFSFLIIALLVNIFTKPVYESYVIAKKEEKRDRRDVDELKMMFSMETMDNLNTEIEIIHSGTVLQRVINELNLAFFITEVDLRNERHEVVEGSFYAYTKYMNSAGEYASQLPLFHNIHVDYTFPGGNFMIHRSTNNDIKVYDLDTDERIQSFSDLNNMQLSIPGLEIQFSWPNSSAGDKIYIEIKNVEEVIFSLKNKIKISAIGETNLARLTVESKSPKMAQILANTIIDNYRNFRLESKRQNVQSSYDFVNSQLEDIKIKLENAENELSQFKRENQIAIMDESSRDVIQFLSNLENEKIKVDLSLSETLNKRNELNEELKNKGYFDQTHLTPQNTDGRRTPFSSLLEQLSDLEIQKLVLLQRRTENHPEVITIKEQIAQVKSKLNEYNQNTLTSYDIIIKTLQKKRQDLNRLIARYSKKIENLPEKNLKLIQLNRAKNVYEKMFTLLLDKREEFRLAELSKMQDIVIIESAKVPHQPVKPKKKVNFAIALILGTMVGSVTIFIKEFLEKTITSVEECELVLPFPMLTIIPEYDRKLFKQITEAGDYPMRLVALMEDQSIFRESYRVLDIKLKNTAKGEASPLIVTSCEENTGKTTVASNYAISLARKNKKVLLIDGDLRKANIANMFNRTHSKPGIIQYLTEDVSYTQIIKQLNLSNRDDKSLDIITTGGTVEHSSELLELDKMRSLVEEMSTLYDHVIIDTPPLTRLIDTMVLGSYIKNMVLVVKPNHSFKDSVQLALEELSFSEINVLGYIVNAGNMKKLSGKYKYGYGYGYGYPVKKAAKAAS
jgi:capsular exopolysaccharide synthesis family protein